MADSDSAVLDGKDSVEDTMLHLVANECMLETTQADLRDKGKSERQSASDLRERARSNFKAQSNDSWDNLSLSEYLKVDTTH